MEIKTNVPIPLLAVVGPTASGKTALALGLAQRLDGEIISADSMQIYKGMDIATAKPTQAEMNGIPHHLIDILDPGENFSVADFLTAAKSAISDIRARGKLPIVAGGTGLYINTLVDNVELSPMPAAADIREELNRLWAQKGGEHLLQILEEFDPTTASSLHPNNKGRIIRAIEVYRQTGIPISEHVIRSRQTPSPYHLVMLGLHFADRQELYDRINRRVDAMIAAGLLGEAKSMLAKLPPASTAAQAIGYKELRGHFAGTSSLEESVEAIKQETRRYAKRQLTWFRRDQRIHWIEAGNGRSTDAILAEAHELIETSAILQ